jgi:hypothetical protein
MAMRRINIYIEPNTYVELERRAKTKRISTAALMRRYVERGLAEEAGSPPPDPLDEFVGDLEGEAGDIDAVVYGL